ncbi:MAG: diguanylate cyclase [Firmicutes bacterium]|nr:diguanylate cyclase [Bacillota bacterium]
MKRRKTTLLFTWIIGLTLLAFTSFNAINYYMLSTDYYEQITTENRIHNETVAFGVSAFFEMAYRIVGEISHTLAISNMDVEQQQAFIEGKFSEHGFFDNIVIRSIPEGTVIARVKGSLFDPPKREWFNKIAEEKKPFVSPVFYSYSFDYNSPIISNNVCYPIVKDDKVVAVVAGFLRTAELQVRVGRYYRGDDRYSYILDEGGKVVVHPEEEGSGAILNYKTGKKELVARDASDKVLLGSHDFEFEYQDIDVPEGFRNAVIQAMNGFSGTTEYTDAQGNAIICSYVPVKMPGYSAAWAAVTVQNKDKAMAALQEAALANALLSFFIFAGLAMLLLWQSRAIDQGARKLADNNAALEEEVFERTRAEFELTAANEQLTAMNEELVAMSAQLQHTNEQISKEIDIRAVMEEKLRLRERQYRAIVQLLTDTNAKLDTKMQTILDSILQLASAEDGFIVVIENESAKVRYVRGKHSHLLNQELPLTEGIMTEVLQTCRLRYIRDYRVFPKRRQGAAWQNWRSVIMLPLQDKKTATGCLAISWSGDIHQIAADELELLQQYADLASLAMQEARTREELRHELLQRKLLHRKISHMAFHDALTGLPNRASLMNQLEIELTGKNKVAPAGVLLFIDLDDLKSINDNFGHSAGDQVIIGTGKQIQAELGRDVFVARLGGDEFIALMPGCRDMVEIERVADRLIHKLHRDYPMGEISLRLSASIGIVRYPHDGSTVEELLKKADMAMYSAKIAGRNCWRFFEPVLLQEAQEKLLLTNSLRNALENQELSLVYQPQVELASGKVVGFEVLLRWNNPEHGVVSPARFIPLAEESQLIFPIGEWVLEEACGFIQQLCRLGYPDIRVSANLSTKQLAHENLVNVVKGVITTTGITPAQLELEITESALLTALEDSVSKLRQIEKLGVRIALDDFGTGYSSLTHLRLFPVETLKIDKSFIDAIPGKEAALVKSLVKFAQDLEMIVVAEGVETQEQIEYLAACGCDVVQGYVMSRPITEEEALAFLRTVNGRGTRKGEQHE